MAIRVGEESLRALHWGKSCWKFIPYGPAWAGRLLELLACCRPASCSREHETHRETSKPHWFCLIRAVQPRPLPSLIACSRIPLWVVQLMAFSPQRLPHRTRRQSDAHQERIPWEPAAAVGRFSLGEEQRGGGGAGCGTHPHPPPAPQPWLLLAGQGCLWLLESCTKTGEGWFGLGFCSLFREGASEGEAATYVIFHLIRVKSVLVCSENLLNI